jgi:oxygen-dependent protoporphyrinogen oxidase
MDARIGIIGAGISGLSAGYQLMKAGMKPLLFEKEPFVGGRMSSEIVEGFVIDKGAYTLPEFHKNTIQTIKEIGLIESLRETSGTSSTFSNGKKYDIKIGSPTDFLKYKLLSLKNKKELITLFLYATSLGKSLDLNNPSEKTFDLEKESAAEYLLREYNQEILELIAYPIFNEIFLGTPEANSKAVFLATIRNLTKFKIFSLDQGLGMLPERLMKHLDVRLNSPVLQVYRNRGKGPYGVDIGGNNPESFTFDTLIFALPPPLIPEIFEDLPASIKGYFKEVPYAPSIVTALAVDQPYPHTSFINNLLRKDFQVLGTLVFDHHKGLRHVPPGKFLATTILRDRASETLFEASEALIHQEVMREMEILFPNFSNRVIFSKVYRWKYGAIQLKPGTLYQQSLARKAFEDHFQNLYVVGDGLYRSSIEVQLNSGANVANHIIQKYNS